MNNSWFVIVNPVAGNSKFNKYWSDIQQELKFNNITYEYTKTEYSNHEKIIVKQAINKGYKKIISVGGDGTLHHVINGIMTQNTIKPEEITIAVIPLGTGNDWIKTYNIPKNILLNS